MAVLRVYRCRVCNRVSEARERIDAPVLTVCPFSDCASPSLSPVPSWQGAALLPGGATGRFVGGEQPFRKPEVIRERDGSETVYTSLAQMQRAERERAPHPKIAQDNVRRVAPRLLAHTKAAQFQAAIEQSSGRI